MKTFGEFYDAVSTWAKEVGNANAQIMLEDWMKLVSPEKWAEARVAEFNEGYFRGFVEDMTTSVQRVVGWAETDEHYKIVLDEGHAFLKAIAEIGRQYGIAVKDEEIDTALSFSEALVRNQS